MCPAAGCVPFDARILAVMVTNTAYEITIDAGSLQSVTPGWTAMLLDANGRPVPNGDITLTYVDRQVSTGTLMLPTRRFGGASVRLSP